MKFSLLSIIALPFAYGLVIPRAGELKTFHLKPVASGLPAGIAGTALTWDTTNAKTTGAGPLGWFKSSTAKGGVKSFVQNNAKTGIVFDSLNTRRSFYLKKSKGSLKEAILGNPKLENDPSATQESGFTIQSTDGGKELFGFGNEYKSIWSVCGTEESGYKLYFGRVETPAKGCTGNFDLAVEYTQ